MEVLTERRTTDCYHGGIQRDVNRDLLPWQYSEESTTDLPMAIFRETVQQTVTMEYQRDMYNRLLHGRYSERQ